MKRVNALTTSLRIPSALLLIPAFLLLACASKSRGATQESSQSHLRRDAEAVALLTRALNAMGGQAAWANVLNATVSGSCEMRDPQSGSVLENVTTQWVTQGQEFRYEADSQGQELIYLSGHGAPQLVTASSSKSLSHKYYALRLPFHLPGILFQNLLNSDSYALIFEGYEAVNGAPAVHLKVAKYSGPLMLADTREDWWFSSDTGLPVKVQFVLPSDGNTGHLDQERTFSSWSPEGAVILPHELSDSFGAQMVFQACAIQSVMFNANLAPTTFDAR